MSRDEIADALHILQDRLAVIDMLSRPPRRNDLELLLKKLQRIRLTMDGDNKHGRPHLHLDYGRQKHSATFAIDSGERLVGNVPTKYDRVIGQWILANRLALEEVWKRIRAGGDFTTLVRELQESEM